MFNVLLATKKFVLNITPFLQNYDLVIQYEKFLTNLTFYTLINGF
jgi:hypothetical protein